MEIRAKIINLLYNIMKTDVKETKEFGIYVHVPFCAHKCLYCDFYTGGSRIADWHLYNKALLNELKSRQQEIFSIPTSLYFGGGTPSLIPNEEFYNLLDEMRKLIDLENIKEFTIEVNPEDVTDEKIKTWKDSGVNRISMGVQSFIDEELKVIGRKHDASIAVKAFDNLKQYFDNISIDIMFGLPGQTITSYKKTLTEAIDLQPTHISSYSLMLENGTSMTHLVNNNKLSLPTEDEWIEMYEITNEFLEEKGFKRYEISNFSQPGFESLHNMNYWLGIPYIGLGPSAHSYDGVKIRRANPNDIKGWLKRFSDAQPLKFENQIPVDNFLIKNSPASNQISSQFFQEEKLTDKELKEEYILTRMRMAKGLNLHDYEKRFGINEKNKFLNKAKKYIDRRLLKQEEEHISFTTSGFRLSDDVLSSLI